MPEFSEQVAALNDALERRGWMLAAAESCTGGMIAAAVTARPGSSAVFDRGFVTYSNAAKQDLLGVPAETIDRHGAVSPETAQAMVEGALTRSCADIVVAVTGIAGPSGGSADKPVGLVYIGWGIRGQPPIVEKHVFPGDRDAVRRQTVETALNGLIKRLS